MMYTTRKSEVAKLREYKRELDHLYGEALAQHDLPRAKSLHALRRRVLRAILIHQEWENRPAAESRPDTLAPAAVLSWPRA
jgi:hypothetical protein